MNVIETSALGKSYGSTRALRDARWRSRWAVVALVGPNGAGKSTLLNLAVGLPRRALVRWTLAGRAGRRVSAALDGIAFVARTRRC